MWLFWQRDKAELAGSMEISSRSQGHRRSPLVSTPSPLRVASGRVVKRIRARSSPLSDNVRRRSFAKIGGTFQSSAMSTTGHEDDCEIVATAFRLTSRVLHFDLATS